MLICAMWLFKALLAPCAAFLRRAAHSGHYLQQVTQCSVRRAYDVGDEVPYSTRRMAGEDRWAVRVSPGVHCQVAGWTPH